MYLRDGNVNVKWIELAPMVTSDVSYLDSHLVGVNG
jgi:hypothetical protein